MEVTVVCPKCHNRETFEYYNGVFDSVFYDEPRFPGKTVYMCPNCQTVHKVGSGLTVRIYNGRIDVPIKIKTDEFTMTFKLWSMSGDENDYDISRLKEVVGRFFEDGSV